MLPIFAHMQKYNLFLREAGFLIWMISAFSACTNDGAVAYRNLGSEATYVGMEACKQCHVDIYNTFIHTGMGQSFAEANQGNSHAVFDKNALVYETVSDFYYFPYVKDSLMYVLEFRLNAAGDTIYQRREKISYIVGSGHHTNSHIVSFGGYIYQAPVTFYTQEGRWDMAPSFREEGNLRFGRLLNAECITCHNHYPEMAAGSENKILEMPTGIECERCHGPGGIHIKEKKAGKLVNIEKETDYSIVNPAKLPRDLQLDLCERCHLQGTAVLEPGKTFFDFRPGMRLSEVVNVFLPRFSDSDEQFIMASQADRLKQSKCFQQTDMTCLSCHNPHVSVRETSPTHFSDICLQCHQSNGQKQCSTTAEKRATVDNQCHQCHMPKSRSIDIAHVRITDHKIRKYPVKNQSQKGKFRGLQIQTKARASDLEMARGYLAFYDKYESEPFILDSAAYYLSRVAGDAPVLFETKIHYLFNKKDYSAVAGMVKTREPEEIVEAWTAYRIAEALKKEKQLSRAYDYIKKAVELKPLNLDFVEKEALILMDMERNKSAAEKLDFVLGEDPKRPVALCNRGLLSVLAGDYPAGEQYYDRAIALNPDYEQALLNKAAVRNILGDRAAALALIRRVLRINPDNGQARRALEYVE